MASETLKEKKLDGETERVEKEQVEIEKEVSVPSEAETKENSEDEEEPSAEKEVDTPHGEKSEGEEEENSEVEEEQETPEKEEKSEEEGEQEKIPAKGQKRSSKKDGGVGSTTKRQKKTVTNSGEAATPNSRPSRERKVVQRYSATSEKFPAKKELTIQQGQGTPLKDIPNVAFKLSKRKADENLQALHAILFGKKAKTIHLKRNIHQFSGFVWVENEEKQRAKLKEKLDKCVKEKLLDFCDVLDVPTKSTSRKEEVVAALLEFLESPHATTEVSLADKLQSQKGKKLKRKKASITGSNSKDTSSSSKKRRKDAGSKKKENNLSKAMDEAEVEDEEEAESADIKVPSDEDDEEDDAVTTPKEDEKMSEEEDEEKVEKKKRSTKKQVSEVAAKSKAEKGTPKRVEKKTEPEKSAAKSVKSPDKSTKTPEVSEVPSKSKGKKDKGSEKKSQKNETESKKASKKTKSKPSDKEEGSATPKSVVAEPSRDGMQAAVSKILKEVDFNTATLSDILRKLEAQYDMSLTHRKSEVKSIIEEVISNMTDEESDGDAGNNGSDAE